MTKPSNSIRAVTFDFWATLALTDRLQSMARHAARLDALWSVLSAVGVERSALNKLLMEEWSHYNAVWEADQRTPLNSERLAWLLSALELRPLSRIEHDAICGAFDASLWCGEPTPAPGALEALKRLHGSGLKLAIISDTGFSTGRTLRRWLARHKMLPYFSVFTFSDEVGRSKPHPEVFHKTLAALQTGPEAAAHIGDSLGTDIAGAQGVGMLPILYLPGQAVPVDGSGPVSVAHFDALPAILGLSAGV